MEKSVIVLGPCSFVVFASLSVLVVVVVVVIVFVESVGRETSRLDGRAKSLCAHLAAAAVRLLFHEAVVAFFLRELAVVVMRGVAEGEALGGGACCSVGDGGHRHDGANDDGGLLRASGSDQGVAVAVIGFHADGGHCEVRAVHSHHGGLRETCLRVEFLDGRMDGDAGGDE